MANLPSNNQRKTGTGFTNLQRILDANKNNKLASTIGTGVTNTSNQVRQNLQTDVDTFNKEAEAQKLNTVENQNRYKNLLANPMQTAGTPAMTALPSIQPEGAPAQTIAPKGTPRPGQSTKTGTEVDPRSIDDFSRYRAGLYAGPTDLKNAAQLKAQAEEAQALGKTISNQGNKFGLLQQYFGSPTYTRGQQGLDSLLMGKAPELQQARRGTVGLNKLTDEKIGQARGLAKDITAQNQAFGKQVTADLGLGDEGQITGGALGAVYNPLVDKVKGAGNTHDAYLRELANYKVDRDNGNEVGIVGGVNYGLTYGANPLEYLQENPMSANVNNVASKEDFARMNALTKLAGVDNTYLTDEDQAGRWAMHKPTTQLAGYEAKVAANKKEYDDAYSQIQKKVDNLFAERRKKGLSIGSQRELEPFQAELDALHSRFNLAPGKIQFAGGPTQDFTKDRGGLGWNMLVPGLSEATAAAAPFRR